MSKNPDLSSIIAALRVLGMTAEADRVQARKNDEDLKKSNPDAWKREQEIRDLKDEVEKLRNLKTAGIGINLVDPERGNTIRVRSSNRSLWLRILEVMVDHNSQYPDGFCVRELDTYLFSRGTKSQGWTGMRAQISCNLQILKDKKFVEKKGDTRNATWYLTDAGKKFMT